MSFLEHTLTGAVEQINGTHKLLLVPNVERDKGYAMMLTVFKNTLLTEILPVEVLKKILIFKKFCHFFINLGSDISKTLR